MAERCEGEPKLLLCFKRDANDRPVDKLMAKSQSPYLEKLRPSMCKFGVLSALVQNGGPLDVVSCTACRRAFEGMPPVRPLLRFLNVKS